jgi:hypothetical protein
VVCLPRVSPPKPCIRFCLPYMPHVLPISFFLIWSRKQYLMKRADHKAPHYCSLLDFPVTSSLLGPNTFLNTLFSNTLSLCSSRSVEGPRYSLIIQIIRWPHSCVQQQYDCFLLMLKFRFDIKGTWHCSITHEFQRLEWFTPIVSRNLNPGSQR